MDDFFGKAVELHRLKDLFVAAQVKNEEFFNLSVDAIVSILKQNMNDVALFLPLYSTEKEIFMKNQDAMSKNGSNVDLNMSWSEDTSSVVNAIEPVSTVPSDANDASMDDENEMSPGEVSTSKEVQSSSHSVSDDFQFVENSLYFSLKDTIEGRIILGAYQNSKILLENRLKIFVIQKLIVENPVTYKITRTRFEEITSQIKELFPTITPTDWYHGHHANAHGQHVSASGCLVNYYKIYRQNLVLAGIIQGKAASQNTSSSIARDNDANAESDLSPLTNTNRSEYTIRTVLDTWSDSFERRQQILVLQKNKKITIRYETYLNTFVCLNSTFGLELLQTDSHCIIERLAEKNAIPKTVADKFKTAFKTRWPYLSLLVCKHGELSQISCIKDFRKTHKDYIAEVPKPILGLFYASFFLTKAHTVATKEKGTFTFLREDCVEHFIKLVENESEVENYKLKLKRTLNEFGLSVAPYVIFCGKLNNITKAYVVVDNLHYEVKDPLNAVEACLQVCIALCTWSVTSANIWLYLLEHLYYIRPNISYAFPPAKSAKTISAFIKKIDPSFTTSETSDTTA